MIEEIADDPRHRRSEELAFLAERSESAGDLGGALAQYAESARLEEENALAILGDVPKVRELFAVSAVALWLRAERWNEAARAGCAFLAQPDKLTPQGVRAIQKLVDRAWRTAEVEQTLGKRSVFVPVEAVLSGGLVRPGLAPSAAVADRRAVFAALLMRTAEWRSRKKYRRAGPSTLENSYDILEAPAVAGSYGLRFYVAATGRQPLDGVAATPEDVVEHCLGLAKAVTDGPEALRELVGDEAYAQAFLRSFRDLAPDGRAVGQVALGAMIRGCINHVARLTPEMRGRLTASLRHRDQAKPIRAGGMLRSVTLRGDEPSIGVETVEGMRVFRIARGEHDDTIGAKLNRGVRIMGACRVNEYGESDDWADDVTLLEDTTDDRPS